MIITLKLTLDHFGAFSPAPRTSSSTKITGESRLMCLCSYIIYTGMEEEVITSDSEDISTSEKSVSEGEDLREMAISEEIED